MIWHGISGYRSVVWAARFLVFGAILCAGQLFRPPPAFAISDGLICPSPIDFSSYGAADRDSAAYQSLSATFDQCVAGAQAVVLGYDDADSGTPIRIQLNTNNSGAPSLINTFRIMYHSSVTNFTLDGAPYASGAQLAETTADSFSYAVKYDYNGGTFEFTVSKDAASNALNGFTISGDKPISDAATSPTAGVIKNFLARRADAYTANEPTLINRLMGPVRGNGSPVNFAGVGNMSNNQFSISTSLLQIARAREHRHRLRGGALGQRMALGVLAPHSAGTAEATGFDVWMEGKWSKSKSGRINNGLGLFYVGSDYRFSSSLLIGVMAQADWSDETDAVAHRKVDGRGWMAGPYMVSRLHDNLLFDGRLAWGRSDNKVSPRGAASDSFDTNRWLAKGQFTGEFGYEAWRIKPHIAVIYFQERQKGFIDSADTPISSQTVSLGRLTFGPRLSTRFDAGDGAVASPYVDLKGIWDFDRAQIVDLDSGLAAGSSAKLRGRVAGGLSVELADGWSLAGEGFYDGIGARNLHAYGGSVRLRVPLN